MRRLYQLLYSLLAQLSLPQPSALSAMRRLRTKFKISLDKRGSTLSTILRGIQAYPAFIVCILLEFVSFQSHATGRKWGVPVPADIVSMFVSNAT